MSGVVDGATDTRERAGDDQHGNGGRDAGDEREEAPYHGAEGGNAHPREAVGVVADENLRAGGYDGDEGDDAEDPLCVETEGVADRRRQYGEGTAVELVDGIE